MKITSVEAIPVLIPFNTEWAIATGSSFGNGYVIVKIHTDEGITGIGEIGRWYEGEFQAGVVHTILNFMQPALKELSDPLNINQFNDSLFGLKDSRFAKAAVDIALYDLKGKALGVPVSTLLGGAYRDRIRATQSIGIKDMKKVIQDAQEYVAEGYTSLKIKIGLDPKKDLELVQTIRKAVGPDVELRVDANQAYSAAAAIPVLREMEHCRLTLIEQPVPMWDLDGMRKVCEALDTPILACESARTPENVYALAHHQAADMINIKICRPRGITGAKKMEAVAEAAGLPVTVGTMLEMGVGTAAAAHFAAASYTLTDTCDCTGPTLLTGDILKESVRIADGYIEVPQGVGLGVELDDEKVEYYRVDNGKL